MTRNLQKSDKVPSCYFDLSSVTFTTHNTNIETDPTCSISHLGPQCPQDYGEGFLLNYTADKWELWRKCFENQTGAILKLSTSSNKNKESNCGVLKKGTDIFTYKVSWRQQYTCFRGGNPRHKTNASKNPRNAPGSRISGCQATLNVRLLKLEHTAILHIHFPLATAHNGHSLKSLADMHAYQPLPEIAEKIESLVCNSHLNQISLKLSLKEWVHREVIPKHMKNGILEEMPNEFDRRYYPTTQDLRNITKGVINKIRKNTFDQDALEILLHDEVKRDNQFQYFLRKYQDFEDNEVET